MSFSVTFLFDKTYGFLYHSFMSHLLLFETKSVLGELKSFRNQIDNQLRRNTQFRDCSLMLSHSSKRSKDYYYVRRKGWPKYKYLGPETNEAVIAIKEVKHLEELQRIIDRDIELLELMGSDFIVPDYGLVEDKLPGVYKHSDSNLIVNKPVSKEAREWKERMEAEKAKHPVFMPENLTQEALDGTKMRSLSEVLIANYLISLGITFVYELPLTHHGKTIYPDFTILSPIDNKTVIIIEHQGAMEDEKYQGKYIRSLLFYLQTDLVPNKDVFFTYNHLNRKLDLRQIDCILHMAFGYEKAA